jgi:hypothetical protein
MTTVVIGGHSRNVGKTSVAVGLIAAFSQYPWTAIKISPHLHAGVSGATPEFFEEPDREGRSDTSRYLAAGASRALWVRIGRDNEEAAVRRLLPVIRSSPYVLIEGNSILQFIRPDLYLLVLAYGVKEFKESARVTFRQADAVVAVVSGSSRPAWKGISIEALEGIPLFKTPDPRSIPKELVDFVQSRLSMTGPS